MPLLDVRDLRVSFATAQGEANHPNTAEGLHAILETALGVLEAVTDLGD